MCGTAGFKIFYDIIEQQVGAVFHRVFPEFFNTLGNAGDVFGRQAVAIIQHKRLAFADG